MTQITTNGHAYSDDGTAALDMRNGGHRQWLLPMLGDVLTDVSGVAAAEASAAASAAAAANSAAAILATSTTSLTPGTSSKTLTTQAGKQFAAGQYVTVTSASALDHQMHGQVTSYSGTTLIVNVETASGTNAKTDWNISLSAPIPATEVGVPPVKRSSRNSNTVLSDEDIGYLIDATGTFTQTFDAAATLGDGWWCFYRNSGTGDITLDPDGTETIDGLTSFVMYPGAVRLLQCDGTTLRSIPLVGGTKTFATSGSYVWAPGINQWAFDMMGGGGGGGGGARAAARYNGGGGGAGERYKGTISRDQVTASASVTCTVGAGGTGGPAATGDNLPTTQSVNTGTAGGNSTLGTLVTAYGGKAAGTGVTTSQHSNGGAGAGHTNAVNFFAGQSYQSTTHVDGALPTEWGGPAGEFGANTGAGGVYASLGGQRGGGVAGVSGNAGVDGINGVNPGDGGYGGSGALNGYTAGKGGNGAAGYIMIMEVI